MKVTQTEIEGLLIIEPRVFDDKRGCFWESYQKQRYIQAGIAVDLVQDNVSFSQKGTLRGLHYQHPRGQGKLVQVLQGEVFDVAVDIRQGSPTWGQWFGTTLSAKIQKQLYIPPGFAHGFCVLSDTAMFMYKCSDYYAPEDEGGIRWDDPELAIDWPVKAPLVSERDRQFSPLRDIAVDRLPSY